ncbi:NHLP bacteriocin export ABC transporter permease/ATPase subunit [Streptomyces sp. WAC06614]|uniref:NHLP bacteriocin export ABC transporter permease/ATPase subunit n=1 Tax=Streptomyces sp. WAC06614 TaxID=2487416 RepID=UPI000F787190|nr:NHLP bacteriocin export ABC transporter permease/ATPase subunit [Streptomyces sp. WAC06614]RSS78371.1 NHLP bacteriocin export ABC transporter permease/ATPase subunit [Streptomyces sp. WAC06614]
MAALGGLGTGVGTEGLRDLPLEGPHVLWLVAEGALDLFAVDATGAGPWHHLGRLPAGTLLLGPAPGPGHTLVGRPVPGCLLRRIELRELTGPEHPGPWTPPGALEHAFALGIGRGVHVLYQAPLGFPTAAAWADEDVPRMQIPPGSVRPGTGYAPYDGYPAYDSCTAYEGYAAHAAQGEGGAATLLLDPALWQGMLDQQLRLLHALDRWIEEQERAHEDRTAAGVAAGRAARTQADRALLAAIGRSGRRSGRTAGPDTAFAACRLVAGEAGIALTEPRPAGPADERTDPVERIASASRVRTRTVRLSGRWWAEDCGPLVARRAADGSAVALLWRRGGYLLVDPATGARRRVDPGVRAALEPDAVMFHRPLPDGPPSLPRLLRFALHGTRAELRGLLLGGLVAVGLGACVPVATGTVLGAYVPRGESGLIVQTAVALMASSVVAAAFLLVQNVSLLRLEGRIEATLQPAVWDRLLRLPVTFFAGRSTGELAGAALGISAVRSALSGLGPVVLQAATVGAANLVLMFTYSVPLALVALALLLVHTAVLLLLGLGQLRHQRRLTALGHRLDNQAYQTLRGLPKLRVAGAESFAYAAWAREFARTRALHRRTGRLANAVTVLGAVALPLCTLVMFALLAGPARGSLSAGEFLTFGTALTLLLSSVTQLTGALVAAAAVRPLFEQVEPLLRALPEAADGIAPGELGGALEVRDLSYRYTDDGPLVLADVSFRIRPGEFVAVVGASGSGKSTLLRLLIGFDRPTAGSVLYDGQDLAALDPVAVRRQCGVVLQHARPFAGSILDCVRGAEAYSLEEVAEAVALAGLAEDVKALPMGLHTVLSDGGGTVSGGQRQRLMIAQALVRRPRLLFLDEATSALDNEAQRVVIGSTRALRCTRVVIAHRLSTVMDADRVIVLAEGRVVQQGPPALLLADPAGPFHTLVRHQLA